MPRSATAAPSRLTACRRCRRSTPPASGAARAAFSSARASFACAFLHLREALLERRADSGFLLVVQAVIKVDPRGRPSVRATAGSAAPSSDAPRALRSGRESAAAASIQLLRICLWLSRMVAWFCFMVPTAVCHFLLVGVKLQLAVQLVNCRRMRISMRGRRGRPIAMPGPPGGGASGVAAWRHWRRRSSWRARRRRWRENGTASNIG